MEIIPDVEASDILDSLRRFVAPNNSKEFEQLVGDFLRAYDAQKFAPETLPRVPSLKL